MKYSCVFDRDGTPVDTLEDFAGELFRLIPAPPLSFSGDAGRPGNSVAPGGFIPESGVPSRPEFPLGFTYETLFKSTDGTVIGGIVAIPKKGKGKKRNRQP